MASPTSDAPRQSLLAFLDRPLRLRTQAHAHAHAHSQTQNQTQAQATSNEQRQQLPSQPQQATQPQLPPLSATLSLLLPQSPVPPRRQQSQPQQAPITAAVTTSTSNPTFASTSPSMQTGSFGNMLRRRRSGNNAERAEANRRTQDNNNNNNSGGNAVNTNNNNNNNNNTTGGGGTGPTHRIRLVPHLDSVRSLTFEPMSRDVRQGDQPLRIGRFTEHSSNPHTSNKLGFKSKVVSRGHAEVWFDSGSFYIKDTKSSSGTFLNHIRLSPPNAESRPFPIKDGDVLQLGVDYQGGTEEMYRCVKIRIELGREWQAGVNAFNLQALQQLKNLANPGGAASTAATANGEGSSCPSQGRTTTPRPATQSRTNNGILKPIRSNSKAIRPKAASKQPVPPTSTAQSTISANGNNGGGAVPDCCICLSSVTILQALFIAPCSHIYHYKCIRPLLQMHYPGFSCPLCRTFANLEADVEGDILSTIIGGGLGLGVDDQMVIDEEVFEDEFEIYDNGEGAAEEGGASGSSENQSEQPQARQLRVSLTPEADNEGDAGAETDVTPEMLGPTGMGGFVGAALRSYGQTPVHGQGFIHDSTVDVDPSAVGPGPTSSSGLRLPLREDDDHNSNNPNGANVTLASFPGGYESEGAGADVLLNQQHHPLIIEDGEGDDGGGELGVGASHAGVVQVSVATLVNKRTR